MNYISVTSTQSWKKNPIKIHLNRLTKLSCLLIFRLSSICKRHDNIMPYKPLDTNKILFEKSARPTTTTTTIILNFCRMLVVPSLSIHTCLVRITWIRVLSYSSGLLWDTTTTTATGHTCVCVHESNVLLFPSWLFIFFFCMVRFMQCVNSRLATTA